MRKSIGWLMAVTAVVSLWSWRHRAANAPLAKDLVVDRVWLDHMPRGEFDVTNVFAAISEDATGAFANGSSWRFSLEGFRFEAGSGQLRVLYPQTGEREIVRARAWTCSEAGMDYCLELQGASRGIQRYYSKKGMEIDGAMTRDALERRLAELAAHAN